MAKLAASIITSSLKVYSNAGSFATDSKYLLDITGSSVWNGTTVACLARIGSAYVGRHQKWGQDAASEAYATFSNSLLDHATTTANYCLLQGKDGSSFLNASSGKLIYFVNGGSTYQVTIGSTGLGIGLGAVGASYTLDVTGTTRLGGNTGVGTNNDGNGRLYIYGAGNTSNCLSIANCNGIATTSTSGRSLAGFIRIWIDTSVSNAGANAFATATNYYIPVYS